MEITISTEAAHNKMVQCWTAYKRNQEEKRPEIAAEYYGQYKVWQGLFVNSGGLFDLQELKAQS